MTPSQIAKEAAEKINPTPFGPPEALERIAQRRANKVEKDAAIILAAAAKIVKKSGAVEALEASIKLADMLIDGAQINEEHAFICSLCSETPPAEPLKWSKWLKDRMTKNEEHRAALRALTETGEA